MDIAGLYDELRKGAVPAARALLGWKLVHETEQGPVSGYIVETEAYRQDDPASHTFAGLTKRNAAMFEDAGRIYVYFTYGMHYCVNIVAGYKGYGEAVLIRALEPIDGLDNMKKWRKLDDNYQLTNGPAKLVQALGITIGDNDTVLGDSIHLVKGFTPEAITQTQRVGISKAQEQPWRFYVTGNKFVSRK